MCCWFMTDLRVQPVSVHVRRSLADKCPRSGVFSAARARATIAPCLGGSARTKSTMWRWRARIRDVHRRRAERLDGELPAREANRDLLSLDRALDALQGEGARALLDEVGRDLRRAVREVENVPAPEFSVGAFPVPLQDRFLDGVLDYYRGGWDTSMDPRRLAQAVVTALAQRGR